MKKHFQPAWLERLPLIFIFSILILLIIAHIIIGPFPLSNEPHYNITKEVCRNEIGEHEGYIAIKNLIRYFTGENEFNTPYINRIYIWNKEKTHLDVYYYNEICEQVELKKDEMLYFYDGEDIWFEGDKISGIGQTRITSKFLDENCECSYGCMKVDNECLESCEIKCPECNRYICGDYTVETWSQAK